MSAQNVAGNVNINVNLTETITTGLPNVVSATATIALNQALAFATGAALGIDTIYAAQLSLAGAVTTLNLHSGLTDLFGNAVAFARVRFWIVQNLTATAGYLINLYTLTATDPLTWLPQVTSATLWVPASGILCGIDQASTSTNGWVVSASHYSFSLDPGANTVSCNVIIAGNSAA